jgi:hypothetical protein
MLCEKNVCIVLNIFEILVINLYMYCIEDSEKIIGGDFNTPRPIPS